MAKSPVYLLSVFYQSAKKQANDLAKILPAVRAISNGDYIAVQYDDHRVAYLFASSLDHAAIREKLVDALAPKLQMLVVEVASFVATNVSAESVQWVLRHGVPVQRSN
jgi:hypothetical protein